MLFYIVRHAWAEERDDSIWPGDLERPLTDKGQKRFAQVVKKLVEAEFAPAVIATSPLARCRQTAELIREHVAGKPKIVPLDALACGADLSAMVQWTARASRRRRGLGGACAGRGNHGGPAGRRRRLFAAICQRGRGGD